MFCLERLGVCVPDPHPPQPIRVQISAVGQGWSVQTGPGALEGGGMGP